MTASVDGCDRWRAREIRTTGMGSEITDALAKLEARDPRQSGGAILQSNSGRPNRIDCGGAPGYSFDAQLSIFTPIP